MKFTPFALLTIAACLQQNPVRGAKVGSNLRAKTDDGVKPNLTRQTRTTPKIIGGQDADEGEYPFFVQATGCGGSLIWKDIVLTAAHCYSAFYDRVLVGGSINHHEEVRLLSR